MTQQNTALATRNNGVAPFSLFDPEQFATMQRVAKMFATSDLVPDMYKISADNAENKAVSNCILAIEIANRIGANVLMVMQNLIIIYGKPSWSSKFLIATINTCGRFEPLKFRIEKIGELKNFKYQEYETTWTKGPDGRGKKETKVVEKTLAGPIENFRCIAYTTAKGSDDILESSPVSIELAINEGWYTKKGSKWATMPKQMLMYRSASFWTSTYAPELSMGMKTDDEIRDIEDIPYEDVTGKSEQIKKEKSNKQEIAIDPEPEVNDNKKEEIKKEEPKNEPEAAEPVVEGPDF